MKNLLRRTTVAISYAAVLTMIQGTAASAVGLSKAELDIARSGKILCSAVFVSGRNPEEALWNSVLTWLPEEARKFVQLRRSERAVRISVRLDPGAVPGLPAALGKFHATFHIDLEKKEVHSSLNGSITRIAKFYGDQGCVILPVDAKDVFFEPVKVESSLPDPMTQAWPMGDVVPKEPLPDEINAAKLKDAIDTAFANPKDFTAAFLVTYKGRILAERYGQDVEKDTQLESWSMGKSLTATLLGILVREGHFNLYDPAPVALWQISGDPRSKIRIADLLRMSSGLKFTGANDPPETWEHGVADHMYVYSGAVDVFQFSINRPQEFPPNTVGRYRNCDPLTLGFIIKQTVLGRGEKYLTFPQRALFDRIGIRKQVLETDPYGNFILTGFDYGTARNWARLGLLYLQDGVWGEERILPEGWAEFVSSPAPAWERTVYGGQFWVNGTGRYKLPRSAYWMAGAGGQRVFIVPSHDLVIVRLGHRRGGATYEANLNRALGKIIEAIDDVKAHHAPASGR